MNQAMNQQRYTAIRRSLNLHWDPFFVPVFGLQTLILTALCIYLPIRFSDTPMRFLAIPIISLTMFRSFAFMHEAVHGLVSKNRLFNNFLGVLSGTLCLLSYQSWKEAHIEHHRWSGNIDKDPVAAMIKVFPTFPKLLRTALTFGWNCWLPTLSFLQHTVFWSITIRYTFRKLHSTEHIFSVVFPIVFWVALLVTLPATITFQILLPSIVLYLIGTEVINAPHHLGLTNFRGETKVPLWEQFKTARTCLYPKWIARFVVLNFNYHTEHHMYPYVPWYHLDKIHHVVCPELKEDYNLDPQFSWILKNRSKDLGTVFASPKTTNHSRAA